MRWRGGVLVRPFALLYFAGIRPDELKRMAGREKELFNLRTGSITIPHRAGYRSGRPGQTRATEEIPDRKTHV
jgi:hypothetical protein